MTDHIEIVEVGPRDGLQNEDVILTTDQKLSLIQHLVDSGVTARRYSLVVRKPHGLHAVGEPHGLPRVTHNDNVHFDVTLAHQRPKECKFLPCLWP